MDVAAFLQEVCAMQGQSGMEGRVAKRIAEEFSKYCENVHIDTLGNVRGVMGEGTPNVLVCAHMDEVGLIVTAIEDNGFLRIWQMGGVDPRILPGSVVTVYGKEIVKGVIGPKPVKPGDDPAKAAGLNELAVDLGLPYEEVVKIISVGDPVCFTVPMTRLMNDRVAYKTFDDRACVTSMIVAMEELSRVKLNCRVEFCASTQEEVGSRGAKVATYDVDPDLAIAFDVNHATTPGVEPWNTMPIDKVGVGMGPTIHPAMFKRLMDTADALGIDVGIDPSGEYTSTDADDILETRQGVPVALIDLPLSYMHTMVETISLKSCKEAGRLLAGFLKGVDENWEEWLCF